MKKQTQQKLNELDQQIEELLAAGNRAGAAAAHSQKALLYATSFDLRAAAEEMSKAGALAEDEGRFEELALAHLAQGKALVNQPGQAQKARDLLQKAAALFHTVEDAPREAEALKELAGLAASARDFEDANAQLDKAVAVLDPAQHAGQIIDLLLLRSNYQLCQTNFIEARQALDRAADLAEQAGQANLKLTISAQQHLLESFLADSASTQENLAALERLQQEALRLGNFKVAGDVELQQANAALLAGDFVAAKQHAHTVRRLATESDDLGRFVRYLAATLVLANAHDALGERKEVLYALLTAKVYLEKNLSKLVGQQINLILDAYKQRWGEQVMNQTIREYQAWMQSQQ